MIYLMWMVLPFLHDYHRGFYTPHHLNKKVKNLADLLSVVRDGRGPDIILYCKRLSMTKQNQIRAIWH